MRILFLLTIVFLLSVGVPAPAQTTTKILLQPAAGGLRKMDAIVNGQRGTFLFDSGSGFSSLSPAFAARIGCHPWGQITGFRMTGQRLDMQQCNHVAFTLAGRAFPEGTVGVFDVSGFLPSEIGPVDGTIALDLFADQALTLSYQGGFVRVLDSPGLVSATAGLRPSPVHVVRDAEGLALTVNLPVATAAGTAWFEMDSGNTSGFVLLNKALASLFTLKSEGPDAFSVSLSVGNGTAFNGTVRVLDLILDGNLGSSFLSTHDVTVDLPHKRAWVTAFAPAASVTTK